MHLKQITLQNNLKTNDNKNSNHDIIFPYRKGNYLINIKFFTLAPISLNINFITHQHSILVSEGDFGIWSSQTDLRQHI